MHNTYRLGFRVVCGQTPHLKRGLHCQTCT